MARTRSGTARELVERFQRDDRPIDASSVASQAGTALDNLILAEEMAERRARQEVEIAAEVQRRLLPSRIVPMETIEYTGHCVQARAVGGDYYDFLDFGPKRMGLALGDVSGKGLYAALLTTHLQTSVRGLAMRLATEDLASVLADVNRSFSESTARNHFATFFIGRYEDDTRRLSYANCGHLPPMIARGDGTLERLGVTASAIGLLDEWTGAVGQVVLNRGDVLAVFSDGVTEAMNRDGDEFGETRLADVIVSSRGRPACEIADRVILEVEAFSGGNQHDDLTLVVVRAR